MRMMAPHFMTHSLELQIGLCKLVKNLASHDDMRLVIRDEGAVPPIVRLLKLSKVPEVKNPSSVTVAAASALWNMLADDEARDIATSHQAVPIVCELYLSAEEPVVQIKATMALMMLMVKNDKNKLQVYELGLMDKFVTVLTNTSNIDMLRSSLAALAVMSTMDEMAQSLRMLNMQDVLDDMVSRYSEHHEAEKIMPLIDTIQDAIEDDL